MSKLLTWLQGKKTYIVAAAGILTAIAAYASGTLDATQTIEACFAALGLSGLRAGVAKNNP